MRLSDIKVILWMSGCGGAPGGHMVQLEMTAKALRGLGVVAEASTADSPDLSGFNIVHGFGLTRDQIRRCRVAGAKVALSTIYWSLDYTHDQRPWPIRARFGFALLRSALYGQYRDKCRAMTAALNELQSAFEMADVLLPNSDAEANDIMREIGVTTPIHVVPNAVDDVLFSPPVPGAPRPIDVLFRGRFEPHKNQLGFIRAMRRTKWRIVLAGPPHPEHPEYYEECQREATGNISIVKPVAYEELPRLYQQAVVHVLPSWFETTGLVSLEAALCGCKIVTTDRGYASDYFGQLAWYCNPAEPQSIRRAVQAAYVASADDSLRRHVLHKYTWQHTAQATLAAYESILRPGRISRALAQANEAIAAC